MENNYKYIDDLQKEVTEAQYLYNTEPSPPYMWRRVAKNLASKEKNPEYWEEQFYENLKDYHTTLGGRILANAGTHYTGTSMLNCYVLGPETNAKGIDSIEEIYKNLSEQALTLKSEGGWGYNFGHIRPKNTLIKGVGVESPGSVKFMELFDKSSEIITCGTEGNPDGSKLKKKKIRKGALMGILPCWHPDVLEFIRAKQVSNRLSKFNLSIAITNDFMEAVKNNKDWNLIFPDISFDNYDELWDGNINTWANAGLPIVIYQTLKARKVFDIIMESTYNRSEPGVFFIDNSNKLNNLYYCEDITATNPCGEVPLAKMASCLLGSINLVHFLKEGEKDWDYNKLSTYVTRQVRMMDNVIDLTNVPLKGQEDALKNKRRLGIGILGYGSALYMLGIRYGSERALAITEKLMEHITNTAYQASVNLAKEKGPFPLFNKDLFVNSEFVKSSIRPEIIDQIYEHGIRNSHLLAIAPTGGTSIYCGNVSGGLEPVFMKEYIRTSIITDIPEGLDCPKYLEGDFSETSHFKETKEGSDTILRAEFNGTVYKVDKNRGLTKESLVLDYGWRAIKDGEYNYDAIVTSEDLDVDAHINTMAVFSKYVDQAISKTINLPNNYPYDKFKDIYFNAWKAGIKGITTYRAGTMSNVLSSVGEEETIIPENVQLPDNFDSKNVILREGANKWYIFASLYPGTNRLFALFVKTNTREPTIITNNTVDELLRLAKDKNINPKWISDTTEKMKLQSNYNKIARMISLCLRHGISITNIVNALEKVEVPAGSFVFQIRKYLGSFIKDNTPAEGECPQCHKTGTLVFQEGCKKCKDCGTSLCG